MVAPDTPPAVLVEAKPPEAPVTPVESPTVAHAAEQIAEAAAEVAAAAAATTELQKPPEPEWGQMEELVRRCIREEVGPMREALETCDRVLRTYASEDKPSISTPGETPNSEESSTPISSGPGTTVTVTEVSVPPEPATPPSATAEDEPRQPTFIQRFLLGQSVPKRS